MGARIVATFIPVWGWAGGLWRCNPCVTPKPAAAFSAGFRSAPLTGPISTVGVGPLNRLTRFISHRCIGPHCGGHCGRTNHPVGYRPVLRLRGFFPVPWNEAFRVRCSASSVEVFFLKSRTYPADNRLFWGDRGIPGQTWRTHSVESVRTNQRSIRWECRSEIDRQLTHQPTVYNDSGESHP